MNTGTKILKNTIFLSIGRFTVLASGILWTAVLARYIGPEIYGVYAHAQSLAAIIVLLVNFGFDQLLIRDVAQKPSAGKSYLKKILTLKIFLAVIAVGIFIIYGFNSDWERQRLLIASVVMASYLVSSFGSIFISMLHAYQAMGYDSLTRSLRAVIALVGGVIAVKMGLSFPIILVVLMSASLLPVIINAYLTGRITRKVNQVSEKIISAPKLLVKSIPFAALMMISVIYANLIILLLRHLTSDDAIVGNFAAAHRIYTMIFIVPEMLFHAIFPAFSSVYATSIERFRSMFLRAYKYMFAITVPMGVGLWVIAPYVIRLIYGQQFDTAGSALRILSLSLLNSVGYIMGPAMVAMGHQTLSAIFFGSALIGVGIAGYLAIPVWGTNGACWAVVAGNAISFFVYAFYLFRKLKISYPLVWVAKISTASLVMGIATYFLSQHINFLVASFAIAPPLYILVNKILKTLSPEDIQKLKTLAPKKLLLISNQ
ncbi:oligosaccharide flippase family protein [Candidatus Poribacteria bacterium]|nr:oligosaccharide flippase family protein [Candidatus Poribacteria bacterium]